MVDGAAVSMLTELQTRWAGRSLLQAMTAQVHRALAAAATRRGAECCSPRLRSLPRD